MKLTYLGSGNAFVPQRYWGCILVNDSILLDAGPTLLASLKRLALDPTGIRHIFISHFHGDHFFGLPFLLLEYKFLSVTAAPLTVIGPPGVEAIVRDAVELAYPGLMTHAWPRPIRFVEAQPGTTMTVDEVTFTTVTVDHGPDDFPAFGYRLHLPDGILAYSGDTCMTETLYALVEGAQASILEAASDDDSRIHLGRDALRKLIGHMPDNSVIFLTHLDAPDAGPWQDLQVVVPEDLKTYLVTVCPAQDASPTCRVEVCGPGARGVDPEPQLRQRERQLQAVVDVTQALHSRINLDELTQYALRTAMATVDADAGSILLHDADRRKLLFKHVEGPRKEKIIGLEIDDTQGIAGDVFQTGRARISHDVRVEKSHLETVDHASHYRTQSMITVPLMAGTGEVIGVLQTLNKRTGPFDDSDREVLQVLAAQVAAAIINAQLFERAQAAAMVDLLGHLSHDIKNLLTPVSLAGTTLRMMIDDFKEDITKQLAQPAPDAAALVTSLQALVERISADVAEIFDILDESTLIAQQRSKDIADTVKGLTAPPACEPANMNDTVQGVCRVLRFVAHKREVTLAQELSDLPRVHMDAKRMYNAVYNLVNNAIGATPPGGSVTVRTRVIPAGAFPDGGFVEVAVQDTGSGMPPEIAAALFTAHVRSTKPGGTGLGTRVVKNVIEAHEGKLLVDSTLGAGTTIAARIPLRAQ